MSTLKVNNLQVGQDATSLNNFTLYQPSPPNGTVRLGVGNSGAVSDLLTLNYSGYVGIGNTQPSYRLQVTAPAGAQSIFQVGQSGISNGYAISSDGTKLTHQFYTTGNPVVTISDGVLFVDAGGVSNIVFRDDSIENHKHNSDSGNIAVNYAGYNAGFTRFRNFNVYDGKGGLLLSANGSTKDVTVHQGELRVYKPNAGNPAGITIQNTESSSPYSHARLRLESQAATAYAEIWADVANSGLRLGYNSTNTVKINSSGNIVFNSGSGIDFSANGNAAGMTSELLDSYEEGTWTPIISGTSGGSFTASDINVGRYTKVGRIVTASATISWSNASYSGLAYIGGLPYASTSSTHYRVAGSIPGQSSGFYATGTYTDIKCGMDWGYSYAYVVMVDETITSGANYSHSPGLNSSGSIYGFTITYQVD